MHQTSSSPDSARCAQRLHWARLVLEDPTATLEPASIDAGQRSYWRSAGQGRSRIVMDSPPGLEDVRPWLHWHGVLAAGGVRLPQVLARELQAGFLLLEDLGQPTLAHRLSCDGSEAEAWIDAAIAQLLTLQAIVPPEGTGVFGQALLQRDADLFDQWFLRRHLGIELDGELSHGLQLVQRRLMDNALSQRTVLTHRDFMPRNLMPALPGPAVLDFQDCVVGPVAYDPVSLFKDAFLSWPLARVDGWLLHYHARALAAGVPVPRSPQVFLRDADWMGVQRHLKILGIFCRLHYRDGKSQYLADLPRFIGYLEQVLPRHRPLQPLQRLLDQCIRPALQALAA